MFYKGDECWIDNGILSIGFEWTNPEGCLRLYNAFVSTNCHLTSKAALEFSVSALSS